MWCGGHRGCLLRSLVRECGWRESNPHGLPRRLLRPVRLPGFATSAWWPGARWRAGPVPGFTPAGALRARALAGRTARTPLTSASRKRRSALDERVELVQRVVAASRRVDVELELDPIVAVGDLEDHPRLEVARAATCSRRSHAGCRASSRSRRVLDVDVDVGAVVEAGQVEQRALVDASAVRHAHSCSFRDRPPLGGGVGMGRGRPITAPRRASAARPRSRRDGGELDYASLSPLVWWTAAPGGYQPQARR